MKRFLTTLVTAIVAVTGTAYAQYSGDAIRFSQTNYGSTARFKGMGGAQIGVGGDLSSLSGNPAGLGLFTKSEFNFTPEYSSISTDIKYLGQNVNTTLGTPNIGQAGVAFYLPNYRAKGTDGSKGIVSMVAGIGLNRVADYKNEYNYFGTNAKNSIADYFAELGGSAAPATLGTNSLEHWAYEDFLISYDNVGGYYFPETFVNNKQSSNEIRKGSTSELNFSLAINISNQVYIGANVGLVSMRYTRDAQYVESGTARGYSGGVLTGSNVNYKLLYNQYQTTTGEGLNGRIGVIFRPVSEFRIGATIQTPTWMDVSDSYTENLDNRGSVNGKNNEYTYDFQYQLRTPFKGSIGASYIIGSTALLTADVDYIDYSSTHISVNYGSQSLVNRNNNELRTNYQEAVNFRVGGEVKLENMSLRAGYALNGSPYKNQDDLTTKMYTGGLGYRINNYYLDLAYQRVEAKTTLSPYALADYSEPVANINTLKNNFFLTVGVRF